MKSSLTESLTNTAILGFTNPFPNGTWRPLRKFSELWRKSRETLGIFARQNQALFGIHGADGNGGRLSQVRRHVFRGRQEQERPGSPPCPAEVLRGNRRPGQLGFNHQGTPHETPQDGSSFSAL